MRQKLGNSGARIMMSENIRGIGDLEVDKSSRPDQVYPRRVREARKAIVGASEENFIASFNQG